MKMKLTLFLLFFSISSIVNAQEDKDNYWILEDFNHFEIENDWNILEKNYKTYPNDVDLTTVYANVEKGYDCAYGQNALRVRGAEEGGYATFTVPNAGRVTFYITGKQKAGDRGARIYRNGTLVENIEGIDRYDCVEFTEIVNSQSPVTYKIIGIDNEKKDPFVLYYIEVQKYGVNIDKPEPPQPDYNAYWIYEDFKELPLEIDGAGDGIYNITKDYSSLPNSIVLKTDSANIELGEGCTGGNARKILRIRGKKYTGGSVEFTVPDAKSVSINITGKSDYADRTVKIYKNDVLVKTFQNLDRSTCEEYYEEPQSDQSIKYRIEGGNNTEKPVAIKSIFVEKFGYSGLNNLNKQDYSFYPNPAGEIIYFKTTNHEPVKQAAVYDMNGRLVLLENNALQMNINNLKKGFYIIKLTSGYDVTSHKLIKN